MAARVARIIANPASGRGAGKTSAEALRDGLLASGWRCEVVETGGNGAARDAARAAAADGVDVVIAVGGDGTVNEVVHGVLDAGAEVPVAHVPTGTTNAIARALGLPGDVEKALPIILAGENRRIDVGCLPENDRYFLLAVTIGDPSRIVAGATRDLKDRWGVLAYFWAAARMMVRTRRARTQIELDDGRRWRTNASGVLIANLGRLASPRFEPFPDSEPDDGRLDVAVVRARGLWDWLRIGAAALVGRAAPPRVDLHQARRIHVIANRRQTVQVDGEVIGRTPVLVELRPAALRIVAPAADGS